MKPILTRAAALALSAAMLASTALASDALGSRIYSYTLDICAGTTLTREVMWSDSRQDLRTENYVTYRPGTAVSPKVSYGASVLSTQTVYAMAQSLEAGGERILSGVNGDYFVMASGDPLGLVVTDGVLRSSASYLSAIGFRADGTAVTGKPDLAVMADFSGYSLKISEVNKIRSGTGYFLFTEDFGPTTKNTRKGVDVILSPIGMEGEKTTGADGKTPLTVSRRLGIGRRVPCRVEEVIQASGATEIPAGKFVLSISETGGDWLIDAVSALKPGDPLDIEISSRDTRWNEVDCAVGSMYHILSGGTVTEEGKTADGTSPRTAVGVRPEGDVIFYTIDGRQPGWSVGATIEMVARRLAELGCTEAMLLDGGGSTSLVSTYPDQTASSAMNRPSEGTPRAVTNALFLVSGLTPTGTPGSLYVAPRDPILLAGGSTQCAVTAMDTGWYPMSALPGDVTWSADQGSVSPAGVFTAPEKAGVYTVTAESGGVTGSAQVTVCDAPDALAVRDRGTGKAVDSLTLTPDQTVTLSAAATYHTVELPGGSTAFQWSADPDVGEIAPDGTFTAGPVSASGKITVTAGSLSASVPVTVSAEPLFTLLADFEGDEAWFAPTNCGLFLDRGQVKLGRQSLRCEYDLSSGAASLAADHALAHSERYLSLWVCGDGSGGTLSASFSRQDGSAAAQTTRLSFEGWKRVTFAVPEGSVRFLGLSVSGSGSGTIWLDQVTLANQAAEDTQPPAAVLTVSGSQVSARLTDNVPGALSADRITLAMDGKDVPFTFRDGVLTAQLPDPGKSYHQVTVTAWDLCGNLGRDSAAIQGQPSTPFQDMTKHWASSYTARLYELGIVNGTAGGARPLFSPNDPVTRGDFALMTARWLGVDLGSYADLRLPYADSAAIPSWDQSAVRALYSLGVMQGSSDSSGRLYARARDPITRAEAITILSRIQARGWPEASLSSFSDAGSVPSWARSAVASLVGQQVVSGADGLLRPNASISRAEVAKLLMCLW